MYEELVKRLRSDDELLSLSLDRRRLIEQAADAIEELSKQVELEHQSGFADGQIAANRKKPRWIPVEERLPPYGDRILVTDKTGVWEGYLSYSRGFMRNTGMTIKDIYDVEVTHWMPLPEPPKEVDE